MTYTLKNIPQELDEALRARAASQDKPLELYIVENLMSAVGMTLSPDKKRDLSDLVGDWTDEDEAIFREVRAFHEQIEPEMWK